jgi:hypothetical protein
MTDTVDRDADSTRALIEQRSPPQPPKPKPQLVAGGTPKALVPVDFEGAWRIANTVHLAGMAPASLNTAEKCMVAILHGLEVGLTPMNALQSIAVINGRPTIWGDGAVGLIRASGLLEYMKEYYEHEDTPEMKAVCVVKRKGEPDSVKTYFSMADAKKAGLLGKAGPWQTYPKRMLKMRARWALRDTFADVLKGLGLTEEAQDQARMEGSQPQAEAEPFEVPSPPAEEVAQLAGPEKTETTAPEAEVEKKPDPISTGSADGFPGDKPMKAADDLEIPEALRRTKGLKASEEKWLISVRDALAQVETQDELDSEWESCAAPATDTVSLEAYGAAKKLYAAASERVNG